MKNMFKVIVRVLNYIWLWVWLLLWSHNAKDPQTPDNGDDVGVIIPRTLPSTVGAENEGVGFSLPESDWSFFESGTVVNIAWDDEGGGSRSGDIVGGDGYISGGTGDPYPPSGSVIIITEVL